MSTIQELRTLELQITDIVDDFIENYYNDDDVLAIDTCEGKITLTADSRDKIKVSESTEIYNLRDLVRLNENGEQETDCDKISDIANNWIFIE